MKRFFVRARRALPVRVRHALPLLALGLVFGFGLAGCSSDSSSAPGFPSNADGDYTVTTAVKTPSAAAEVAVSGTVAVSSTAINGDKVSYEYITAATVTGGSMNFWYIKDGNGTRVGVLWVGTATAGTVTRRIFLGSNATAEAISSTGIFTLDTSIASLTTWYGIAEKKT